ncbi:MAG: uracil-DNA glycosylase [Methanotrichaceae archaeon]|nr:uracil-DNA glycosylase [Methanotrichaceae archaeon]
MNLDGIREEISRCRRCALCEHRRLSVPGEGPCPAEVMLIGEAPGAQEDLQGRPFVGRAGAVLDRALSQAGLQRDRLFITNVVKCRPPSNRRPLQGEIRACRSYLEAQIELVRPRVVCLLGNVPTQALLGMQGVTALHGQVIEGHLVTFHPAAVLRRAELEPLLISDLAQIGGLI